MSSSTPPTACLPKDTNGEPRTSTSGRQRGDRAAGGAGCIRLISSGRGKAGASFLDASLDGTDAFFLTDESLFGPDPGGVDLYDARVKRRLPGAGSAARLYRRRLPGAAPEARKTPTPGTGFLTDELNAGAGKNAPPQARRHRKHHAKKRNQKAPR